VPHTYIIPHAHNAPLFTPAGSPAQQQGGGTGQSQHDQQQQKQQQEESIPADPRLVGRLRWGLEGEVVGVQAPDEVLMPSQVCDTCRDGHLI
jgi:hypothetical protein